MTGRRKMTIGWTVLIIVWLLTFLVPFAVMETYALRTDDPDAAITLSRFVWEMSRAFPLLIFMLGHVSGGLTWGLAVHFFWHWDPENQNDRRG